MCHMDLGAMGPMRNEKWLGGEPPPTLLWNHKTELAILTEDDSIRIKK